MAGKKKLSKKKIINSAFKKKKMDGFYQPKIGVIGIGGGGGSIVGEIAKSISRKKLAHANRIKFVVANVDEQAIKMAPKQAGIFYFGEKITYGLGCGMNVAIGEESALQKKKEIEKLLKKCDFWILVTCLGGGTGSGAGPVFAEVSKNLGILTLGICTLPFRFEGKERVSIAKASLEKIKANLNAFVVIPNQRIFRIIEPKTSIQKSLSAMNNVLVKTLEGLIETLYSPGLINLDFSDFQAILKPENGLAYLNCQEFSGLNRAEKSVEALLKNPLISYNITGAERMLFNITGEKDMKMSEVELISKRISDFSPHAKIIFGVLQDGRHKNKIKITLLAVGCEQKLKIKKQTKRQQIKKKKIESLKKKKDMSAVEGVKKTKLVKIKEEIKKEKTRIIKKKAPKRKFRIAKKTTVRRNALDLHKQIQEDERRMLEEESKWDIPAFLREDNNS